MSVRSVVGFFTCAAPVALHAFACIFRKRLLPLTLVLSAVVGWLPEAVADWPLTYKWHQRVGQSGAGCAGDAQGNCAEFDSALAACQNGQETTGVFNIQLGTQGGTYPNRVFQCVGNFPPTCLDPEFLCSYGASAVEKSNLPFCTANATQSPTTCACNAGFLQTGELCNGGKNNGRCGTIGNPCNPGTGNKFEQQVLYRGPNGFELTLSFNTHEVRVGGFGARWRDSFDRRVDLVDGNRVAYRPDGKAFQFVPGAGGTWVADAGNADRLIELSNPTGPKWELHVAEGDQVETYDQAGSLLSIRSPSGLVITVGFADGTGGPNGSFFLDANGQPTSTPLHAGILFRFIDHFGRVIQVDRSIITGRITKITDPGGGIYRIAYDANHNLTSITFPDNTVRTYLYNELEHTGGAVFKSALTGIIDENNVRFATFQYDSKERAVVTEHAGGVNRYSMLYGTSTPTTAAPTDVTDPLGITRTYSFEPKQGALKHTGFIGSPSPCPSCGPASQTYDANGNPQTRTDWNGNRTDYGYDLARNLETSRTEGLTSGGGTTPQTRTITTTWHSTFRLPIEIVEPGRTTSFTHDANGNVLTKTVTAGSSSRTWTYTYNANGSVLTMNGPRTDVADVTTYTYYANNATCTATLPGASTIGCRGQLQTIANAVGHVTSIAEYNAHGQPLAIVDPNGLTTTLAYDLRQRLTSRSVGSETTSYEYDGVGQLKKVTLPDNSFLSYTYDNAHRLTEISDNFGNRIVYTLDAMGNRTQEDVRDPSNALAQTRTRVFNELNRLTHETGAASQTTAYGYDNQGNLTSIDGPLAGAVDVTTNAYDALNRLFRVTDPNSGQVNYGYDALDQLTSVTDPRTLVTTYNIDGLGNLNQQVSPDSGTTNNTLFDAAGNLKTSTDARGVTANYSYDALNRVSAVGYSDGTSMGYTWDSPCANGKGRLCSATRTGAPVNATSGWSYDAKGRVTQRTETVGTVTLATQYAYDATSGRLTTMTYPGGAALTYAYDANGRVTGITANPGALTLLNNVTYHPFGRVKGWTWGNGSLYDRTFDQDGRVASIAITLGTAPQLGFGLSYDPANRITAISDSSTPPITLTTYAYDNLDRLTSAVLPASSLSYTYDEVGNRRTRTLGGNTDTYSYPPTNNRLSSVTPPTGPVKTYSYDGTGNVTGDGTNSYSYDARGRMTGATVATGPAPRQYNALGQRSFRSPQAGITMAYAYDEAGRLIGEYTNNTLTGTIFGFEYVYLDGEPVGVAVLTLPALGQPAQYQGFFFVHPDHLGTPRLVTNTANQVRWRWDPGEPFGANAANENPSGLGVFPFSLRFPGQVLDKETNLHYNYFRDYDPGIGRYIQSDPIGLIGGTNVYTYVYSRPLNFADPNGLVPVGSIPEDPNQPAIFFNVPWRVRQACSGPPPCGVLFERCERRECSGYGPSNYGMPRQPGEVRFNNYSEDCFRITTCFPYIEREYKSCISQRMGGSPYIMR